MRAGKRTCSGSNRRGNRGAYMRVSIFNSVSGCRAATAASTEQHRRIRRHGSAAWHHSFYLPSAATRSQHLPARTSQP